MMKFITSQNKLTLVLLTTLFSVVSALLILFIVYRLFHFEIRTSEIILSILSPLIISFVASWYLCGLIEKLESLEKALRESISKEKEDIYLATIHGAQHVTNNLLNGLILIEMEIDAQENFSEERKRQFRSLIEDSDKLLRKLSSVDDIDADKIRKSVAPQ